MITIFTPIYNRITLLKKLYNSLINQTSYDFEWIVIDDGSEDPIVDYISRIALKTTEFPVYCKRQEHGGKIRAWNKAAEIANGELFFIVDSDDILLPQAIERMTSWWNEIKIDMSFAGVSGLRVDEKNRVFGKPDFASWFDGTYFEAVEHGITGDKADAYRTNLIRKFPIPIFDDELYTPEGCFVEQLAEKGYKMRWYNEVIYKGGYLEDGITRQGVKKWRRNPKGLAIYYSIHRNAIGMNRDDYMVCCRDYYELIYDRIGDLELTNLLGLTKTEKKRIDSAINETRDNLISTINSYNIPRIALFGYGNIGKKMSYYLYSIDYEIQYIIDRNKENIVDYPAYTINDQLPDVDVIIICMRDREEYMVMYEQIRNLVQEVAIIDAMSLYVEIRE